MAARGFSLSDLVPEPLEFRDDRFGGDGTTHDVMTGEMLGASDAARLQLLQTRVERAIASKDEERLGRDLDGAINEMLAVLIPTLSAERREAIPLGIKARFLEWWRDQQEGGAAAGEAGAGEQSESSPA